MSDEKVKSHARVVVIGGGIAGCSTLYHLTREGWTDVVLVERDELTSGSTWHAAAQVTQFGGNQTMFALKRHSIDLYRELADDPDHPFSYHITGGMRLAHTQAEIDIYKHFIGSAAGVGVEMEFIDGAEAGRRHPLLNTDQLLGAWWDPLDGDIDPAGITFALARKARHAGASVYRFNPVHDITKKTNGEFVVHTKNGDITCEKVVNASGYRVNEVGAMLGVTHPVTSMEHMYFLTDPIPEIEALDFRVPIIRDPGDDFYSRQEKNGLLVGVYEQGCKTFGMQGIDPSFTQALCPSDLDRCLDNMERIFERLPALQDTGIHTIINGPITYTIDGAPLIGQIPGIQNAYCAIGLRAGIGESGGHGKILAEIIVHGECEWDAWYLDPRRFTEYANTELTSLKAIEDYQNEFHYHLPHEFRPAGRLARTTPLYSTLDQMNCAWGVVAGWERVLFVKPDREFVDEPGFRFNPTKEVVAREIEHLCNGVSLCEVSGFNRYQISGDGSGNGAAEFLDRMVCGAIPVKTGKVRLCYLLTEKGNVLSEAVIAKISDDTFWFCSAAAAEWHDRDWLLQHIDEGISLTPLTSSHTAIIVAGPDSRKLLQATSHHQKELWSKESFGWMQVQQLFVGHASVTAMSVSYSGELAFELHVPNEQLYLLWQELVQAGKEFNLGYFGLYAAESMRLEKGYRHWKADLLYEFTPLESGLERFVDLTKSDFIGKSALEKSTAKNAKSCFVSMVVDCDFAAAHGGSPVYADGVQVGTVTSGGYGARTKKNIAYAFVDSAHGETGQKLTVGILGEQYNATVVEPNMIDPENARVRA